MHLVAGENYGAVGYENALDFLCVLDAEVHSLVGFVPSRTTSLRISPTGAATAYLNVLSQLCEVL